MRFGTVCLVKRGSTGNAPWQKGCLRYVRAIFTGARGNQVRCRLLDDDNLATVGPFMAGQSGWWGRTALVEKGCGNCYRGIVVIAESCCGSWRVTQSVRNRTWANRLAKKEKA